MKILVNAFNNALNCGNATSSPQLKCLHDRDENRQRLLNNLKKFNFQLQATDLPSYYQKIQEYSTETEHAYGDKTPKNVTDLKYSIHHIKGRHFISRPFDSIDYPKTVQGRYLEVAIDLETGEAFVKKEVRRQETRTWVNRQRPKLDSLLGADYEIEARILDRYEQTFVAHLHREAINHETLRKQCPMYYLKRHEKAINEKHYIYLPYVEGEDLCELFNKEKITNAELLKAIKASIELVRNLHSKKMVLSDYSLENIVLDVETKQVSLIDFESLRSFDEAASTQDFWGTPNNVHREWFRECAQKGLYHVTPQNDYYAILKTITNVMQIISAEIEDQRFHEYYNQLSPKLALYDLEPLEKCPGLDELETILDEAINEVSKYENKSENRCLAWCCITL